MQRATNILKVKKPINQESQLTSNCTRLADAVLAIFHPREIKFKQI